MTQWLKALALRLTPEFNPCNMVEGENSLLKVAFN